jgi:hypothetical protein
MGKYEKLVWKVLSGQQDTSIRFSEAIALLKVLGFTQRIRGGHNIFFREGVEEIINLQPDGSKAKPYQVKQIRNLILKYRLEVKDE